MTRAQKKATTKSRAKARRKTRLAPVVVLPPLAMTVAEFCERYRIKRNLFYDLLNSKRGPATIKIGKRRIITITAAEAWERQREAATAAAAAIETTEVAA